MASKQHALDIGLRNRLEARHRSLMRLVATQHVREVELQEAGDGEALSEVASRQSLGYMLSLLEGREERELRRIELALERLDVHGGRCACCHKRIERRRLQVVPEARECAVCVRRAGH